MSGAYPIGSNVVGLILFCLQCTGASYCYNKQHDDSLCELFPFINLGHSLVVFSRMHFGCAFFPCILLSCLCVQSCTSISPSTCSLIARKPWCLSLELSLLMSNVYGMGRAVTNDMRLFSHCKSTKASMHVIMFVYSSSLNHFRGRYLR